MTLNDLFGKKGNATILLIAVSALGLGGNSLYNDTNETTQNIELFEQIAESFMFKHEAQAYPHSPYDVKFDMLDQHMKTDIETSQKIITNIEQNHKESLCKIQQLKDLYYKIPETDCT